MGWLLLLCLLPLLARAQPELALQAGQDRAEDYRALSWFCQPQGREPDAARLLQNPAVWPWQAVGPGVPNRGLTADACWFHLRLRNADNPSAAWFLVVEQPLLQQLDVHVRDSLGRPLADYITGADRPLASRPYPSQSYAFPLQLPAGAAPIDIYLRVASSSLQVPLALVETRRFADDSLVGNLIQGLFIGSMLIMILYNFFLFVSIREPAYFFYVCWSLAVTLIQVDLHGIGMYYLWPPGSHVMPLLLPAGVICCALFTLNFLSLRQRSRRLALLLGLHIPLGLLVLLYALWAPTVQSLRLAVPLFLSMDVCIFIIAVYRSLRGDPEARLFGLAWLCFLLGAAALALDRENVLPQNLLTRNLAQLGSFIEVALLSLALANRINRLKTSQAGAQLEAMAANTRSKASSEFLATMSHEIRTPMNGVLGLTDLLRHTPLDSQQLHYVDTIYESSNSLLTIINDILDYSRIESGQLRLEAIPTPLEPLLDGCVGLFGARAMEKGLRLLCCIEAEVPALIESDPARLKQILNNLLSNAIKFTEQGEVRLCVSRVAASPDGQPWLEFAVEDSGIGLSAEQCERLFQPFSQADSSTTRRYGGSGLGLSICRSLCQLLSGEIGVSSQPGQGSRFWFRLPVRLLPAPAVNDGLHGQGILLAVADEGLARSLYLLLQRWGMQVSRADDARAAATQMAEAAAGTHAAVLLGAEAAADIALFRRCRQPVLLLGEAPAPLPAGGTVVPVALPLRLLHLRAALSESLQPASPVPAAAGVPDSPLAGLRVLVAEDNAINQVVIGSILKSAGITPHMVANGCEALEEVAAPEARWDVVFMDCEMPEMDGYEATRRIRALEQSRGRGHCWIVALSAHAVLEYIQKAHQAGVDDYLSKPISRQQVLDALQRAPAASS